MWDLKLSFFEFFFYNNLYFIAFFDYCISFLNIGDQNGFNFTNSFHFYQFNQNVTFFFGIKFLLCIAFLILIRGGTPRYRYDYLTKLGWLKFVTFTVLIFFLTLLFTFLF